MIPGDVLLELALGIGLASALVAGSVLTRTTSGHRPPSAPLLTLVCFCIITPISIAQLTIAPQWLPLLMRNADPVYSGEPWRLLTSLLVQDGGWPGAAFNLVALLAIGSIAEIVLGRRR